MTQTKAVAKVSQTKRKYDNNRKKGFAQQK